MKFTLSWLRTHLDTDATLEQLTDRLTAIGLELEGITDPGQALRPFRVAHIIEAVQHPNADRLRACTVDAGDGPVSVVCGAPNARTGLKVVFAPPGSVIPGSGVTLKVGEIRGVVSAGMLLSRREMGLGEDHDGIVELPDDAPIGASYPDYAGLDDPVIDISVTPNRGDALSVRGVARDLAAAGLGRLKPWGPLPVTGRFDSPVRWAIEDREACPWIVGRTVRGLTNGPSPAWLQARLLGIGLRPINALVDVTNFFTIDLGRPLHVFDADRVQGGVLTLRHGAGESFRALNGRDYTADPADCVIADAAGVQSLAGVMGGEATGCTETTTAVFIECALFDPVRIALTGRRHAIVSDARQRFERGVDQALLPDALEAATHMIQTLCGGEASTVETAGAEPAWRRTATLRFERLAGLGGLAVKPEIATDTLERLGFTIESLSEEAITVAVPAWRNDIAAPIVLDQAPSLDPARAAAAAAGCAATEPEADLVEEVLRIQGLDTIPPVSLPRAAPVPAATLTPRQIRAALARRVLAAAGLLEAVSFSFMQGREATFFGGGDPGLRLLNPISADLDQLRPTPVASLALAAARNAARGLPTALLFEVGPAFTVGEQETVAAGLFVGGTERHPLAPTRPYGAMDAKAAALAVIEALEVSAESLSITTDAPDWYHPGRSGVVRQGPKLVLATFGELHPSVSSGLDVPAPAAAFEVFLDRIPEPKRRKRAAPELSPFQPLRRDFAFVVADDVPADAVLRAARGAERTLISGASLFDVYRGDKVPAGQKSIGVEITLQPTQKNLTEAEIDAVGAKVIQAVTKRTGGALR